MSSLHLGNVLPGVSTHIGDPGFQWVHRTGSDHIVMMSLLCNCQCGWLITVLYVDQNSRCHHFDDIARLQRQGGRRSYRPSRRVVWRTTLGRHRTRRVSRGPHPRMRVSGITIYLRHNISIVPSLVRHVPSWFPGTGWKKTAAAWRQDLLNLVDAPHRFVLDQLVRSTIRDREFVSVLNDSTSSRQRAPRSHLILQTSWRMVRSTARW